MSPGTMLFLMIFLIPIVGILTWGGIQIAKSRATIRASEGVDPQLVKRLEAVENELGAVQQQLAEAHERLDFTERLLTQQRQDRLGAPR